jgi:hypothetical protein
MTLGHAGFLPQRKIPVDKETDIDGALFVVIVVSS